MNADQASICAWNAQPRMQLIMGILTPESYATEAISRKGVGNMNDNFWIIAYAIAVVIFSAIVAYNSPIGW